MTGLPSRADFPILSHTTYLNSAAKGALCAPVRRAIDESLGEWETEGAPWDVWLDGIEITRSQYARLVGTDPSHVFVAGSVSAAFTALLSGLDYHGRPEVLLVEGDFPTLGDAALAATRVGARPRFVDVAANADHALDRLIHEIRPSTGVVVIGAVHHAGAYALDLDAVGAACRERDVLCLVDVYHSAGVRPLHVGRTPIDAAVTGCMKYLLGAAGGYTLGYCGERLLARTIGRPPGWLGTADPFAARRTEMVALPTARRFDGGLPSILAASAARAGLDQVLRWDIGAVADHVDSLTARCAAGVAAWGTTPADVRRAGPLVCLRLPDPRAARALVTDLARRRVVVGVWQEWLRVSLHGYNSVRDVEAFLDALSSINPW